MEKEMKKEAELRIHLIKVDHSVIERRQPLAMLPQIFPVGLVEVFIQPLDRKTKTNGKLSAMVYNIRKPTLRIDTQVNTEEFLFATNTPCICHKALPRVRLIAFDAHSSFPFAL